MDEYRISEEHIKRLREYAKEWGLDDGVDFNVDKVLEELLDRFSNLELMEIDWDDHW